jgi:hypothetical protein
MKTNVRLLSSILMVGSLAGGCVQAVGEEATPAAIQPRLSYTLEGTSLRGDLKGGAVPARFAVVQKESGIFDVTIELNGLVVSAIVSQKEQTMDFDGFTAGTGAATQIRDEDRALLRDLHDALGGDATLRDNPLGVMLEHGVSVWSQMSDSFPLVKTVHADQDKSYASMCDLCGQFVQATHDCDVCDRWSPGCTSIAQLGTREDTTFYFINGGWIDHVTPDHIPDLWERGECFGNCGLSCSEWGNQQLTEDCFDHDQCVRNGHWIVSGWCDDEFASTVDDEFAAPNCSRFVADTVTVHCRATKNFKGWYVISSCDPCPAGTSPSGYTNAGHPTQYPSLKCSAEPHWVCP